MRNPALHAAGALVVYFGKKGDVSGSFDVPHMAEIIERECLVPERKRLARRLRKAARTNTAVAQRMKDAELKHAESYAEGSQFAFNHAARIVLGQEK
jgi:hypothetical protein